MSDEFDEMAADLFRVARRACCGHTACCEAISARRHIADAIREAVAAQREACAKVADDVAELARSCRVVDPDDEMYIGREDAGQRIAAQIRARGKGGEG